GLHVFGVVVLAADDDEIFEPTCDEQLAFQLKTQITSAQEWSAFGTCLGGFEERRECLLGFGRPAPVPLRNAPAGVPDLPNLSRRSWPPGHRIHDHYLVAALCPATAHKWRGGRMVRRHVHDTVLA